MNLFPWKSRPESAERRLTELRAEKSALGTKLADCRASLGAAVADGDESAAAELRSQLARSERRALELDAAVPIAQRRVTELETRAAAKRHAEELRRQNELREARLRAAHRMDAALRELGAAYGEYRRAASGLAGDVRTRLGQREKFALRAALFNASPDVAYALGVDRAPVNHWRPLAQSESTILPIHEVHAEKENDDERIAV